MELDRDRTMNDIVGIIRNLGFASGPIANQAENALSEIMEENDWEELVYNLEDVLDEIDHDFGVRPDKIGPVNTLNQLVDAVISDAKHLT